MAEPLLRTIGLHKSFGGVAATCGVNIAVQAGEFRAIIGPNGAGKSTLFNQITGFIRPDAGRILFDGEDLTRLPTHRLFHKGIGRTFQITSVMADQSVRHNIEVALLSYHRRLLDMFRRADTSHAEERKHLLDLVGLSAESERLAGVLSHGDQKRLELAVALANRPRMLLLDEPTAGMAANERLQSMEMIRRIATQLGVTVIFTEHDMEVVFSAADSISVLHQGAIIAEGTPEAIRANKRVQDVYLGQQVDRLEDLLVEGKV